MAIAYAEGRTALVGACTGRAVRTHACCAIASILLAYHGQG
jgi:hypothetical protein